MPSQPRAEIRRDSATERRLPQSVVAAVVLAIGFTVLAAAALSRSVEDGAVVIRAAVLAVGGGSLLLWLAARHFRAPVFGAANSVTLVRAALTVVLVAMFGVVPSPAVGWVLLGIGTAAVALDGVDGALARGRNEASSFGARFDMETDALLILVLAALVWQHGKAGVWILVAGFLRYAFVAVSWALPWLGAALPASRRRQAVCVVQIVSLLGALAPALGYPWSGALALAGLAALVWSFGVDVHWLARHAHS
jgi:phosphatidylglycerophosphate synthase